MCVLRWSMLYYDMYIWHMHKYRVILTESASVPAAWAGIWAYCRQNITDYYTTLCNSMLCYAISVCSMVIYAILWHVYTDTCISIGWCWLSQLLCLQRGPASERAAVTLLHRKAGDARPKWPSIEIGQVLARAGNLTSGSMMYRTWYMCIDI